MEPTHLTDATFLQEIEAPLMAQIRIQYQIDNASFDETPLPETKRILNEILECIRNGSLGGLIQDLNGNGVGAWVIEGHDERYATKEEE